MSVIDFSRIDGLYSDHQRRVASLIKDIFPSVRLVKLDSFHPHFNPEKPFALIDEPNLAPSYLIRTLAESEIDHRLIASLAAQNMHDPNSQVNKIDLLEKSYALLRAKEEEEWAAEKKDVLKSAMASKQHSWTHAGKTLRK